MQEEFSKFVPEGYSQDSYLQDLLQRASIDTLSGLLNRSAAERFIKDALKDMDPEDTCALFIVDLDDFKRVNDTLGHQAGDQAIRQAANVLSSLFRAGDIVGRLGGDEFVVFLRGKITEEMALEKAAAICEKLQIVLNGQETVNITASVGVHLAGKGQAFEGLYQSADLALYKAKKAGKHQFCLKNWETTYGKGFQPANVITLGALLKNMESGVALLEMGEAPRIIYVSPSFCRMIGVEQETYPLPKLLEELIHPQDLKGVLSVLRGGVGTAQIVESTHRVRAGAGRGWFWWQVRAVQIEYDSPSPVMMVTTTDVSKFKETQQDQEEHIRRLQTAFDLTSRRLWEVDLISRSVRGNIQDSKGGAVSFPEGLVAGGWIHANSVPRFRIFAQDLLRGSARGFGNFAIREVESGCYCWASMSYRMMFDEEGRPVRAVGVIEDLPRSFTGGDDWSPDQYRMPESLMADLIMRMRANLDLDKVESLWIEGNDFTRQTQDTPCSQVLSMEKQKIFCKGDQQGFLDSFDRDALLRRYQAGQRWFCAEYRRADHSGSIRWVRHVLYLAEEPVSRQVYLFAYLIWLDPSGRFEGAVRGQNGRDAVTRLYDRDSVQRIAEMLFTDRKSGNRAVAMLQVNGLEKKPAGPRTDRLLYDIAAGLSLVLGGSCLLGQYSRYKIVAVFPDAMEGESLRSLLEEAVATLRRMLKPKADYRSLRLVAGVDLMPATTANYRAMLTRINQICTARWNAAADTVVFAQEDKDWHWPQLQIGRDGQVSVHTEEMERPLSEREKDVALDCVSIMLAAKTLDASLLGVLQAIGEYYQADRAYFMMLVENSHTVIMTFEWTNGSKRSIQQAVSGMPLDRFPLLKRCIRERAPVFLTRSALPDGEEGAARPWHYTVFPLIREPGQTVVGFLCIENAQKHPADAALFSTLIPFILQQRERFNGGDHPSVVTERLMNLPDLRAYNQAVYTLNSEYYGTMGVLSLDIPNYSAINADLGFEHSGKMLWYVAKSLAEIFGSALLFRTWEAEFVVFYPNATREVFLGHCGRLWTVLQRRYPRQVRMGQAWAGGAFNGKRLAEEANAAMKSAHAGLLSRDPATPLETLHAPFLPEGQQGARFEVYFQPKIDLRTGALAGAEALVRWVEEDGTVAPPAQFVLVLEETGAIREMDFFVLERSLAQAEKWRAAGLGVVPMAVNISRVTLANPATLASILAIQSRYPNLPGTALELEITERGEGINTAQLQEEVDKFHACGLHVSLDDFGSQYANFSLFVNVKFETVKLDRSLIAGLKDNPINRTLVQDLVRICQTYGITCVAEGVETKQQAQALLEMGCLYAQGFYYDPALPAEDFERKYLRGAAPAGND